MSSQANTTSTSVGHPLQSSSSTDNSPVGLLVRIANVRTFLQTFKSTLQTRHFLYLLLKNKGNFCATCTVEHLTPGTCGPTCALLRTIPNEIFEGDGPAVWLQQFTEDYKKYRMIEADVEKYGGGAVEARVKLWELFVKQLKEGDETPSEHAERLGLEKQLEEIEGMDLEWTFDKAWGSGREEEELVPPEAGELEVGDENETEN